ncbi:MAG TPA: ABC transporter permease subunit [Paludibaculum sp.]|jgi:peptide/nickel transport system permease protein
MRLVWRLLLTLAAGALLTALLVRTAPGYGVHERDLDIRRNGPTRPQLSLPWWYSREFQTPIHQLVAQRAMPTALAVTGGLALAWLISLASALASTRWPSRALLNTAFVGAMLLQCLPAGLVALLLLVFGFRGTPAVALALALALGPRVWQVSRAILARAASSPCLLLARAQGFGPWRLIARRLLPLAAPELRALGAVSVTLAISLAIPLETILDVPGLGQLAWQAALSRDLPLLVQLMTLVTLVVVVAGELARSKSA